MYVVAMVNTRKPNTTTLKSTTMTMTLKHALTVASIDAIITTERDLDFWECLESFATAHDGIGHVPALVNRLATNKRASQLSASAQAKEVSGDRNSGRW